MPKSVPKSIQTCFRVIFLTKFYAQCSMEGRVFENFQRNQKIFKIPKMPKIAPKSIQTCFELVLGQIFRKIFLPSVPWRVELRKFSKKNIFKIPKMPKSVPKSIQTCFEHVLGKFFLKNFCPVFHGKSSLRKISIFFFQKSKNAQKCSQKYPNVF